MNVDCRWFDAHFEAYFCEALNREDLQLANGHLETCLHCRNAVQSLHDIDPLVKGVMEHRLNVARTAASAPRRSRGFQLGLAGAVLAAAAVLAVVVFSPFQQQTEPAPQAVVTPPPSLNAPGGSKEEQVKVDDASDTKRAKPDAPTENTPEVKRGPEPVIANNAAEFLVISPEGYATSLQDYKGRILVVAVWSADQPDTIQNLQKLYRAFGSRRDVQVLGVSSRREARPAGTTFPMVFNNGSRLLETKPANYAVVDKDGTVQQRGALNGDATALIAKVRAKVEDIGGK